jgi:uncharacterized protein (DUF952 family)
VGRFCCGRHPPRIAHRFARWIYPFLLQVGETARKYFSGQPDLVILAVASDRLGEALKNEPSRGGDLFPHLYAPLALSAVLWSKPLPLSADGVPALPDLEEA